MEGVLYQIIDRKSMIFWKFASIWYFYLKMDIIKFNVPLSYLINLFIEDMSWRSSEFRALFQVAGGSCPLCFLTTVFSGGFFVLPNPIDIYVDTVDTLLFLTFLDNPVVVSTVITIWLLYIIVLIYARRKDIRDRGKVRS